MFFAPLYANSRDCCTWKCQISSFWETQTTLSGAEQSFHSQSHLDHIFLMVDLNINWSFCICMSVCIALLPHNWLMIIMWIISVQVFLRKFSGIVCQWLLFSDDFTNRSTEATLQDVNYYLAAKQDGQVTVMLRNKHSWKKLLWDRREQDWLV